MPAPITKDTTTQKSIMPTINLGYFTLFIPIIMIPFFPLYIWWLIPFIILMLLIYVSMPPFC